MPAKPKSRRQVLTDFRRSEILDAALKLFGKKGFAETRMDDVAEKAKVAKGTLYLYFSSKEEIYEAAISQAAQEQKESMQRAMTGVTGTVNRLRVFLTTRMSFWATQPNLYRMLVTIGRERRHRKQTHGLLQTTVKELVEIFEDGVRAGELPARDFEPVGWALMDLLRGMNERRMYGEANHTPEQDTATILSFVLPVVGLSDQA
ncbi:TetR/AcrR family transcriptional regulator [Terriglobus tenax]|uniref:TetR/AcrR family transcriptional regulator n=1 Tax=Terriglobus tenax TaxID=1111115 RepID=UPI0021DF613B|nr:TetR/AcrR family transcriptional regulator [Terriglobus tenax]